MQALEKWPKVLLGLSGSSAAAALLYEVAFYEAIGLRPFGSSLWLLPIPLAEYVRLSAGFLLALALTCLGLGAFVGAALVIAQAPVREGAVTLGVPTRLSRLFPLAKMGGWFQSIADDCGNFIAALVALSTALLLGALSFFVLRPAIELFRDLFFFPYAPVSAFIGGSVWTLVLMVGFIWLAFGSHYVPRWLPLAIGVSVLVVTIMGIGANHAAGALEAVRIGSMSKKNQLLLKEGCGGRGEGTLLRGYQNGYLYITTTHELAWLPSSKDGPCLLLRLSPRQISTYRVTPTLFGQPLDALSFDVRVNQTTNKVEYLDPDYWATDR